MIKEAFNLSCDILSMHWFMDVEQTAAFELNTNATEMMLVCALKGIWVNYGDLLISHFLHQW